MTIEAIAESVDQASQETAEYGGFGGQPFPTIYPGEIGFYHGSWIAALLLNGKQFGSVSNPSGNIVLGPDEYISTVDVTWGSYVNTLRLTTNTGRSVSGGNPAPKSARLENIRVIGIGGRCGTYLDAIIFRYIKNYVSSNVIENKVDVIVDLIPPGSQIIREKTTIGRTLERYMLTSKLDITLNMSISAKAEYIVEINRSANINIQSTTTEEISREIERTISDTEKETLNTGDSYGFTVCSCDIYRDNLGNPFVIPKGDCVTLLKGEDNFGDMSGSYTMFPQVKFLKGIKLVERNGLNFIK